MKFSDVFTAWLALGMAGGRKTNAISFPTVDGLPSKLRRGKRMSSAFFPTGDLSIYKYGWKDPIYFEYKGAVRAARIKRVEIVVEGGMSDYGSVRFHDEYFVEVAGLKKEQKFRSLPDFAESAEDFAKGNIHDYRRMSEDYTKYTSEDILKDCLGDNATIERYEATRVDFYWSAKRFKWDGIKPEPYFFTVKNFILFDGEHFHMDIDEFEPNTWPDEESCRNNNRPPVVEFKEE